jgi:glycerol-3-phosphate dehydrogenase
LEKHFRLIDHQVEHQIKGLVSVISVKYTTARGVVESALNLVMGKLGKPPAAGAARKTPLWGGDIEDLNYFMRQIMADRPAAVSEASMQHLAYSYGTALRRVLAMAETPPDGLKPVAGQDLVLAAEVIHACRYEMALTLADVVRRRTELGSAECPNDVTLQDCASLMAREFKWDVHQTAAEIEAVRRMYRTV